LRNLSLSALVTRRPEFIAVQRQFQPAAKPLGCKLVLGFTMSIYVLGKSCLP